MEGTTVATTVRIDSATKRAATALLDSMGISFNGYINMAVTQLVNQRKVPFEIMSVEYEPTDETRRALLLAEAKEAGLIPDDSPVFTDVDEFIAALQA